MRLRPFRLSVIGLALLIAPRPTHAAEPGTVPRYSVKWSTSDGAESCQQHAELHAAVSKLVSAERLSAPDQSERVIVGVASHQETWRAQLRVEDLAGNVLGERVIESDAKSCAELNASVALAIALLIDPEHLSPPAPAVLPPAPPPRSPTPSAAQPAPNRNMGYEPRPIHSVKASVVVASGLLPDVALGAQVEFWLPVLGADSVRLAFAYFAPQARPVPERTGVEASFYAGSARFAYCPMLAARSTTSVFGCAGLASGVMVASGQGGGYDATAQRWLLALDAAVTVDRSLVGPWALSLTMGAGLALYRPIFSYDTADAPIRVYRRGAFEGRFEIGASYRF